MRISINENYFRLCPGKKRTQFDALKLLRDGGFDTVDFGMEELTPYLNSCKARRVYFNHVFPLDKYLDIEMAKSKYSFEIGAPNDGDILEL